LRSLSKHTVLIDGSLKLYDHSDDFRREFEKNSSNYVKKKLKDYYRNLAGVADNMINMSIMEDIDEFKENYEKRKTKQGEEYKKREFVLKLQ